jgi:hypothetical protein
MDRESHPLPCTLAAFAAALALASVCPGDEVDDLVGKLKPPARFTGHKPAWSVEKQEVSFQFMDGPQTWPFWLVKDGGRIVAIIPCLDCFHNGTIYVQDFRPGHAPKQVRFPKERWHIDTSIGSELRTNNFIPAKEGATDATYEWKVEAAVLRLTRRYKGTTKFDRWAHRTKAPVRVDACNTIVFRLDAVLGYVVEATFDTWTDPPPRTYEYVSAATSGRYLLWPGEATCFRHAIARPGGGYVGYACNHGATKRHGREACREGGFVSFLNDQSGWSPTWTIVQGGDATLVVCGAHTDLDFVMTWPESPETRDDGLKHHVVKHRMLALPPELTKYVWDHMKLLHEGESKLMIRFGVLEDFEAQPLPLTTRLRGMPWNAEVTTKHARSGSKSITFSGHSGHGDPQIALKPGARYRLEAWVKVIDWTPGHRKAAEDALREKVAKAKDDAERPAARGRKPRPIPELKPLGPPEAYLSGWFYQWSPHSGQKLDEFKSNVVGPSDKWQQVAFELATPPWAPFIQLDFHANNCTVYLDDFQFVRIDK